MNKQRFLLELRKGLTGLPRDDIEERLSFYNEMIDDRMEEGLSEPEAVRAIGSVDDIVSQVLTDTPLTKLVKEKVKPRRAFSAWETVLLILGSPIWFSLLIAVIAVIFSVYAALWSVIISLWSIVAAFAGCALGGVTAALVFTLQGNGLVGLAMLGAGACCAGLSIFSFFGCKAATKCIVLLTKKIALGIKSLFVGKETVK